jgi:hypothetical protein
MSTGDKFGRTPATGQNRPELIHPIPAGRARVGVRVGVWAGENDKPPATRHNRRAQLAIAKKAAK